MKNQNEPSISFVQATSVDGKLHLSDTTPEMMADAEDLHLHETTDASVWARQFCAQHPEADEGTMIAWFANAIMAGYDKARRECEPISPLLIKQP